MATACLLEFAGFLCFDKLINLLPCDFELLAVDTDCPEQDRPASPRRQSCSGQDRNTYMPNGNTGGVLCKDRYVSER